MITLGYSLMHLLDNESARRGLTRMDMIECISLAISETFKRRGRIVSVSVDDRDGEALISLQETVLTGGSQALYREVAFIPPFSPELLADCIDDYVAKRQAQHKWTLAESKVIARAEDHLLVEVLNAPGSADQLEGQVAVLPFRSVTSGDHLPLGAVRWLVVKRYVKTRLDSGFAEPWRDVDAPLLASRSESEFLALMAHQMLGQAVDCVIHSGRGILIFPPGEDLQPLLAHGGKHVKILRQLTGLKRLVAARRSAHPDIAKKLIHAIKEIAGLQYGFDYKLGAADPRYPPRIYVTNEKAERLIGVGGSNLYFIKSTVGFQFSVKSTYRISKV